MSTLILDGFDDYGVPGVTAPEAVTQLLNNNGWTYGNVYTSTSIVPTLNREAGYALSLAPVSYGGGSILSQTLAATNNRLIGGFRFNSSLLSTSGITFLDTNVAQMSLLVETVSGLILAQTGAGTTVAISSASVAANTTHYFEFDITFEPNGTGGVTIWLDGVQVLLWTGVTSQSGNAWANMIQLRQVSTLAGTMIFDDLYLFNGAGTTANAVVLSNPIVYTQKPIADYQTQFTNNGNVAGNTYSTMAASSTYALAANKLYLQPFTPNVNCTANTVVAQTGSGGPNSLAKMAGVLYADSAGVPGALLSAGTQLVGFSNDESLVLPLTSSTALVAGTQYWAGLINDSAMDLWQFDGVTTLGTVAANTYTSGAPGSAPSMARNQNSLFLYVECSGAATNWESVAINPPLPAASAISATTSGISDLYVFANLPTNIQKVYTVGVKGTAQLSATGTRTLDLLTQSGLVVSAGSITGIAPTLSPADYNSYFDVDPSTTVSWTVAGVNGSYNGVNVAS
jgi:hypothetical protein